MLDALDPISREQFDAEVERLRGDDEAAGRPRRSFAALASAVLHAGTDRPGAPAEAMPELPLELLYIEALHGQLGSDANGRATVVDMRELLDELGVGDPGEREAFIRLWRAMEAESSRYLWEQRKAIEAEREHQRT